MSAFYTGLRSTAATMLGGKGRAMTLHKRTPGAYDPATAAAAVTEVEHSCTGAEFDFPALLIDGTMIQRGDKKVLLSALGLTVTEAKDPKVEGVVIKDVDNDSDAALKGLKAGDVILEVQGQPIKAANDVVAGIKTGGRVVCQFYSKEMYDELHRLEFQSGKPPEEWLKTIFGVRPKGGGYEFYIIEQFFRPAPT